MRLGHRELGPLLCSLLTVSLASLSSVLSQQMAPGIPLTPDISSLRPGDSTPNLWLFSKAMAVYL